jgi:hypothetical protein
MIKNPGDYWLIDGSIQGSSYDIENGGSYYGIVLHGTAEILKDGHCGRDWSVQGNKSFQISHPTKENTTLRHGAFEGPVSGGLVYRDRVEVTNGTATPDFPSYVTNGGFGTDWVTSVTPVKHYGNGYLDTDNWEVNANKDGEYDIMVFGIRDDNKALSGRGSMVEKPEDMSWDKAADKAYGGTSNDSIKQLTPARDNELLDDALLAHAIAGDDDDEINDSNKTRLEKLEKQ